MNDHCKEIIRENVRKNELLRVFRGSLRTIVHQYLQIVLIADFTAAVYRDISILL
jgi:hypothetical protein